MKSKIVVYPTSLEADQSVALASAVGLASAAGARLVTIHAGSSEPDSDARLQQAQELATKWERSLDHEIVVHQCCDDVADTLLDAVRSVGADLVIMGTHGRGPVAQILSESVAEVLARNLSVPTFLIPLDGQGLTRDDGSLAIRRVLVAAGDPAAETLGVQAAKWLAGLIGAETAEVILVHAEAKEERLVSDQVDGIRVTHRHVKVGVEDALARLSAEREGVAIVMATRGHDGLLDAIAGSHTERVLRRCGCPLLAVPMRA